MSGPAASARNRALGIFRLAGVYGLIAALAWWSRPTPAHVVAGGLFWVAGESVRSWAAGHLLKSRELVTSGPYRYTRNPLYLGRILIFTGLCFAAWIGPVVNATVLVAGWLLFGLYYLPRKLRVEGARLRRFHGAAWEEYARAVPVLFPRWPPHGENRRSWSVDRYLRNREHWMVVGGTVALSFFAVRALTPPPG